MYDELVKQLKYCANSDPICEVTAVCPFYDQREEETHDYRCVERMMSKAADAIEELQKRVPKAPHGRLIDADALCKTLRNLAENEYTPETFANWIEHHIDTIIPAEEGE